MKTIRFLMWIDTRLEISLCIRYHDLKYVKISDSIHTKFKEECWQGFWPRTRFFVGVIYGPSDLKGIKL